jgi:catechol 2,3-dioxygenase-like lactoylglutathione lyase family enzyme
MFARIRHLATHTERYDTMAKFYANIFGMKQITTGLMDENSKANAERGHISDGVIGMALLAKRAGSGQGLDHFGFEVEDVRQAVDRIDRFYPELLHTKALAYVPFAGIRAQDPTGVQFDLSQKGQSNVREGYLSNGWEQPRWLNHIALRAREPEKVAEFYTKILELKGVEEAGESGSMILTDGKVRLIIRRCHNGFYRTMRQGFDHIGFQVDSIEQTTKELANLANAFPECAVKNIAGGVQGSAIAKDLQACPIGQLAFADPDGVLVDICE